MHPILFVQQLLLGAVLGGMPKGDDGMGHNVLRQTLLWRKKTYIKMKILDDGCKMWYHINTKKQGRVSVEQYDGYVIL